jgi:hypothetical protein
MFSKVSILVLFLRFLPQRPKKTIYATIAVVVLYSLIGSFYWLFACRPLEKFWDLSITHGSCIAWFKINIFSGVMNTATDIFILLLPIFMLRKVRLPKREWIGLVLVMMTGGLYVATRVRLEMEYADMRNSVLVISIIRLKTTVDMDPNPDITWEYVDNGIWWLVYITFELNRDV